MLHWLFKIKGLINMDAIENITQFIEHRRKYGAMRKASSQDLIVSASVVIPIILFSLLFLVFVSNQVSAETLEVYTKVLNVVGLLSIILLILLIMVVIRVFVEDKHIDKLAEENRTPFIERYENVKDYELMSIFNELLEPEVTGYKVVELVDGSLDIIKYKE